MKIGSFLVEVNAGWEWFATTILDVGPTDLIAVANRSHTIFKLFSGSKNFFSDQTECRRPESALTPEAGNLFIPKTCNPSSMTVGPRF
jgi:hypothetical protein